MKKCITTLVLGAFLMAPLLVFADHDTSHTIQQLQAQVQALQAQILKLQQLSQPATPPPPTVTIFEIPQNIPSFNRDLYFGMRNNSDVTDLQELLTDQGYYAGPITGNFGLLTLSAVKKFQSAHGISPTGYFGPRSRAVANEIIQKLVGQICPREEGCEGNVFPVEKIYMTADSDLGGTVGQYLKIGFKAFGGSGNYYIQVVDGEVPGLGKLSGCEISTDCPKDKMVLAGTPTKSGVFGVTFLVTDLSAKDVYGTERFTIVIKDKVSFARPPVITGIEGPTNLKVGEDGLWSVGAYDPQNGSLSYRVIWGDEAYGKPAREAAPQATPFRQTAHFSHTYYVAGVYSPIFYIASDKGLEAKTSISVKVVDFPNAVSEQVKCVFTGSTAKQQNCYVAGPTGLIGCEGVVSCLADVQGQKGDKLTWKSSCGGYAFTTIDGVHETAEFNCTPAVSTITVLSPNGGEVWPLGSTQTITWRSEGLTSNYTIGISAQGAGPDTAGFIIGYVSGDKNSFTYQVNVAPDKIGKFYELRLCAGIPSSTSECAVSDQSDAPFSIVAQPPISDSFTVDKSKISSGEYVTFKFSAANATRFVFYLNCGRGISVGSSEGAQCNVERTDYFPSGYTVKLVNTVATAQTAVARVSAYRDTVLLWTKELRVDVLPATTSLISVLSPYEEESWNENESRTISWTAVGGAATYKLTLLHPDVSSFVRHIDTIPDKANLPAGAAGNAIVPVEYVWNIPLGIGSADGVSPVKYYIRVAAFDSSGNEISYGKSGIFTIGKSTRTPSITVLSPNGGEKWILGTPQTITWSTNASGPIRISLVNASTSFEYVLTVSEPNDGTYAWDGMKDISSKLVPAGNYRARIQDMIKNIFDYSDAPFNIVSSLLDSINNQGTYVGKELSFVISATGVPDGTVTFSAKPLPVNAKLLAVGDFTMDGTLSSLDGTRILQYVDGLRMFSSTEKFLADVNRDGTVTKADGELVLNIVVGNQKPKNANVFVWKPDATQVGSHVITFSATAGETSVSQAVDIKVLSTPSPPPVE